MRILLLSLIGCSIAGYLAAEFASQDVSMDEFKWKNRIILMSAPSSEDPGLIEQINHLAGKQAELTDRDLRIIQILGDGQSLIDDNLLSGKSAAAMKVQFGITGEVFQILLIGKDGAVKLNSYDPVSAHRLFSLIDSMPMRQREMRGS